MKKILLAIVIVLLSVMTYATISNGYGIGNIKVLGLPDIKQKNDELDAKIEEAEKIKSVTYVNKISELNSSARDLIKEKKSYEELITYSSLEDITKANQTQKYEVELLWAKIGMYATSNGVKLKLDITSSSSNTPNANDLKIVATGSYIAITDFVSDLEKDAKLEFTIENFALVPTSTSNTNEGINLQATFRVKDIILNLNTTTVGNNNSQNSTVNTKTNTNTKDNQDNKNK